MSTEATNKKRPILGRAGAQAQANDRGFDLRLDGFYKLLKTSSMTVIAVAIAGNALLNVDNTDDVDINNVVPQGFSKTLGEYKRQNRSNIFTQNVINDIKVANEGFIANLTPEKLGIKSKLEESLYKQKISFSQFDSVEAINEHLEATNKRDESCADLSNNKHNMLPIAKIELTHSCLNADISTLLEKNGLLDDLYHDAQEVVAEHQAAELEAKRAKLAFGKALEACSTKRVGWFKSKPRTQKEINKCRERLKRDTYRNSFGSDSSSPSSGHEGSLGESFAGAERPGSKLKVSRELDPRYSAPQYVYRVPKV